MNPCGDREHDGIQGMPVRRRCLRPSRTDVMTSRRVRHVRKAKRVSVNAKLLIMFLLLAAAATAIGFWAAAVMHEQPRLANPR